MGNSFLECENFDKRSAEGKGTSLDSWRESIGSYKNKWIALIPLFCERDFRWLQKEFCV